MRHRRKALLTLLSAVMLIMVSFVNIGVVKASPTKVLVNYNGTNEIFDTTMVPDTTFTINITVDYVEELWGYQFILGFNPAVLQGVSYGNGPFLASAGGSVLPIAGTGFDNTAGKLNLFGAALYPKAKFPTGGGVLAYVTFRVVGYGESPIEFRVKSGLQNKTAGWIIHLSELEWDTVKQTYIPKDPPHTPEAFVHGIFDNRPPMYVSPSQVIGVPVGETFSVNVSVAEMEDISSWSFYMSWAASLLNVTGVGEGDFGSFLSEINNEAGYLKVDGSTAVTTGTLANITFLVEDLGKSNLTIYNAQMLDSTSNPIPIRIESGFFNNYVHDISIIDIKPDPTRVEAGSGDLVHINVTLRNSGAFKETGINVTAYFEENEIDNQTAISLEIGEIKTFTFTWNTTSVPTGKYRIKATASPVVNETDIADNTYSYRGGWVTIFLRNIAIAGVTVPLSKAFRGQSVIISVSVVNMGTEIEDFNVTAYYITPNNDEHEMEIRHVKELGYLEKRLLRFIWNITTEDQLGDYTVKAVASSVEDETNFTDNTFVKSSKLHVVQFEQEFPTELATVSISIVAVVVGVSAILFIRGRRLHKREEEQVTEFRL